MIPIRITLKGFLSYRDVQTLDFSDDSIWVLLGKNASGKSSIFDAIVFALFDTPRAKGIKQADLINHQSDMAEIEFDFAVGSKLYRVNRNIEKKNEGTRQASVLRRLPDGSLDSIAVPGTHRKDEFDKWVKNDLGLNFKTFTTAVLLRQGQADAFLSFSAEERYDVLEKLIDLSKYQALSDKANEHRKFWKAEAASRLAEFERISRVTDEDFNLVHLLIASEEEASKIALKLEGQLVQLFGLANQWEQLQSGLHALDGEILDARRLLANAEDIRNKYWRWVDLREIMHNLKTTRDLSADISSLSGGIRRLSEQNEAAAGPLEAAENRKVQLETESGDKQTEIQQLTKQSGAIADKLSQLSGTISLITRINELRESRDKHQKALDQFPSDLDATLRNAQNELLHLQEARQAAPWLKRLFAERQSLAEAEIQRADITRRLGESKTRLPGLTAVNEMALAYKNVVSTETGKAQSHLSDCKSTRDAAARSLKNFNEVAGQTRCSYCGKALDDNHKATELVRLTKELATAEEQYRLAEAQFKEVQQNQTAANNALEESKSALRTLELALSSDQGDLERAEKAISLLLQTMIGTFRTIPSTYRIRVAPDEPTDVAGWLYTVYPEQTDLDEVNKDSKQVSASQAEVDRLGGKISDRGTERALLAKINNDLTREQAALPADWETAQAENIELSRLKLDLTGKLEAAQDAARTIKAAFDRAAGDYGRLHDQQVGRNSTIEANLQTLQRTRENCESLIASLPEKWQSAASNITTQTYESLRAEMLALAEYEGQYQLLSQAEHALSDLESRAQATRNSIELIPVEARCPAAQVNRDLTVARESGAETRRRLVQAELRLHELEDRQNRYSEAERASNEASCKAKLFEQLADRLGEKGLQREIINKAELAIVRFSNQMLDNLSGGRSQLKLREGDGSKKALDLEVYDRLTGAGKPLLVSLASGSQRFRIAISLALGIGQYIGHESHKIESVIIDEGFGSLDKEGRESVIQELYNLRNHLKRIILISHQEEFSRGFSTGYEIQLVDGSSQVRPLIQ
jgi:DNA repair protein SbcC/Rad50